MNKIKELFSIISVSIMFLACVIVPNIIFADPSTDIDGLLEAISSKNYPLVVAFALSIVVYFIRRTVKEDKFPRKYVPYIVLALAVIGGGATGIVMFISEDMTWWHGLIKGVLEGLSAGLMSMGFWSSGLKAVLKVEDKKSEDTIVE